MRMRRRAVRRGAGRRQQGSVLVFTTLGAFALLALSAWALETGQIWSAKGQLQSATDSAALAGAGSLIVDDGALADPSAAVAAAQAYGPQHTVIGTPIQILASDVETGSWDLQTRTFTPLPGSTDPDVVRAVRVLGRRDAVQNGEVATFLGRILGVDGIPVDASAIGYIGFAGVIPAGASVLPIAVDCCAISGSACDSDYCEEIAGNPPNPCPLEDGPNAGTMVTCVEYHAQPEQNVCWTDMDPDDTAVNVPDLLDIVQDGNPIPVGPRPIWVDNGNKTPVIREIDNRFEGKSNYSGNPSGTDLDGDGDADSWLVPLPIVECQNPGNGCSRSGPQRIVGVACFELQEVKVVPDQIIKGSFVCPGHPRWEGSACDVGFGPGGEVPSISAQAPVLVR
jgi:Flp pilus assembly protein TadG